MGDGAKTYGMNLCDASANLTCLLSAETPLENIVSYDDFFDALLVNTIAISIGYWSEFMSWMEQVNGAWAEIYFVCLELFGSLFVLELVVAVLFSHLESNKRLYYKSLDEDKQPLERRKPTQSHRVAEIEEFRQPTSCCQRMRSGEDFYCKLGKTDASSPIAADSDGNHRQV